MELTIPDWLNQYIDELSDDQMDRILEKSKELNAMTQLGKKKWLGSWPANCDICGADLTQTKTFFDAKTRQGPWGLLCPTCFGVYGVGVGPGRGQEYDSETRVKLHG